MDINDIGVERDAVEAATRGNFGPLAELLIANKPLGDAARRIIATRLTNEFKAKRGTKPKKETVLRNKDIYLEFLHLRQTGECPSDDVAYATIADRRNRKTEGIRKAVKAGQNAMSNVERHILKVCGMS